MLPQYYELKDEDKLPITGSFIDPYDSEVFTPLATESLSQFIDRITRARQEKNLPEYYPHELRPLVVLSLAETCSEAALRVLFLSKAAMPEFSSVTQLAKIILHQRRVEKRPDFVTRQGRAAACKGCKLHNSAARYSTTVSDSIKKFAGLGDVLQSDEEKSLGVCGMCKCSLPAKVGFDIQGVLADLLPEQLRNILLAYGPKAFDTCWILKESLENGVLARILGKKVEYSGQRTKDMLTIYKSEKVSKAKSSG